MIMSVCVCVCVFLWVPRHYLYVCERVCESLPLKHWMDTEGKAYYMMPWTIPLAKTWLYSTALG